MVCIFSCKLSYSQKCQPLISACCELYCTVLDPVYKREGGREGDGREEGSLREEGGGEGGRMEGGSKGGREGWSMNSQPK